MRTPLSCKFLNGQYELELKNIFIEPSQIVFVVGPNGSGKTTLLKGVSGLLNTAPHLPFVFMSSQFSPQEGLTGNDLFDIFEVHQSRYFDSKILKDFKVEGLLTRRLDQLSSGERQKLFLATILFHKSDFIALDEPLNFLDLSYHGILKNKLQNYAKMGRSFLISNHDFNWQLTFDNSQTWVVFKNQIFLSGTTSKVLSDIKLGEAFGVSSKVVHFNDSQYFVVEHEPKKS